MIVALKLWTLRDEGLNPHLLEEWLSERKVSVKSQKSAPVFLDLGDPYEHEDQFLNLFELIYEGINYNKVPYDEQPVKVFDVWSYPLLYQILDELDTRAYCILDAREWEIEHAKQRAEIIRLQAIEDAKPDLLEEWL